MENLFFFKDIKLKDVDPKTLHLYSREKKEQENYELALDKNHVYIKGVLIPEADPETFIELGYLHFNHYKDKKYVYNSNYSPIRIEKEIDAETFEILSKTYNLYKDFRYVYVDEKRQGTPLKILFKIREEVDIKTLKVIKKNNGVKYFRDKNNCYDWEFFKKIDCHDAEYLPEYKILKNEQVSFLDFKKKFNPTRKDIEKILPLLAFRMEEVGSFKECNHLQFVGFIDKNNKRTVWVNLICGGVNPNEWENQIIKSDTSWSALINLDAREVSDFQKTK